MGRLVDTLSKSLLSDADSEQGATSSGDHFSIEVSYTIGDESLVKDLKASLQEIVIERNNLIHNRLMQFDWHSKESCEELIRELNGQRERLKPLYKTLMDICSDLREFQQEFAKYAKSEVFADDLKRAHEQNKTSPSD